MGLQLPLESPYTKDCPNGYIKVGDYFNSTSNKTGYVTLEFWSDVKVREEKNTKGKQPITCLKIPALNKDQVIEYGMLDSLSYDDFKKVAFPGKGIYDLLKKYSVNFMGNALDLSKSKDV